ncbi:MAG: serine hydrolase, partial [Gemmatimonadetes bacterium]|nr:serine hydrolase [Gemmatimonadota bacterium]
MHRFGNEVHDENTARLAGVSGGHRPLQQRRGDLLRFGEWTLAGVLGRAPTAGPTPPKALPIWTRRQDQPAGSSRGLGWDTPSGVSSAGTIMSARSYGHTGFTGTSIWGDPDREIVIGVADQSGSIHPQYPGLRPDSGRGGRYYRDA